MPQAKFTFAEDLKSGPHRALALCGSYGGPAKESVEKQIENIERFVNEHQV